MCSYRAAQHVPRCCCCTVCQPTSAGDWLVEGDGSSMRSHFMGSRFLAGIDGHFDYKAERQARLVDIRAQRAARIRF